ncbi:hypothetical protein EX227_01410 [Providencia rettgeri]|uniref:Uncharacterized protein n=1 Tax=Providencia rettgeri TaxID=587 RepID=A0AAP2JYT5_PRORE|nr:hypothetical protein CEQ08_17785 [Providencia rettgeri]HCI94958.1 hypothetical protein [Providencia sp.]MBX6950289.1 hypothetical protein [Providencia rettgeri]MBX6955533.1 hypothetical protein [Providencia rettgeri]MBX6961959.1 hypothetical protein [Providencia rettgeri]
MRLIFKISIKEFCLFCYRKRESKSIIGEREKITKKKWLAQGRLSQPRRWFLVLFYDFLVLRFRE